MNLLKKWRMLSKEFLDRIREDLKPLEKYAFAIVLYGSVLTPYFSERSDIDVAIITKSKDREYNKKVWAEALKLAGKGYDIKVFELLPLWLKAEIIRNYKVIYGNKGELSEYFYFFRKLWKDMEFRIKRNKPREIKEMKEGISNLKKLR